MKLKSLVLLLGISSGLMASLRPSPGAFGIQGEYLYWKPSTHGNFFVYTEQQPANASAGGGERVNNDPDFASGFRIEGIYTFLNGWCENSLRARYTRFKAEHFQEITGGLRPVSLAFAAFPFNNVVSDASSDLHFTYNAGDLVLDHLLHHSPNYALSLFGGLHFASYKNSEFIRYVLGGATNRFLDTYRFWGVGPEIGVDFSYVLPCSRWGTFSLVSDGRISLLASQLKTNFLFSPSLGDTTLNFPFHQKQWQLIPMMDLRLGINWMPNFFCFKTNLEIGYEMLEYWNAINKVAFPNNGIPSQTLDLYANVSFHGPYIAIGFAY